MGHGQVIDHMFYDGLEDAYDKGRLMGAFAEDCAEKYRVHARGAGRVRDRVADARAAGEQGRLVRLGDRAGRPSRPARATTFVENDEQPSRRNLEKIPDAEARVPQGRHGDRRELELDLRRRRGAGDDAPLDRARSAASRRSPWSSAHVDARAGAGLVHDRAGRRDRKSSSSEPAGRRRTSTSSRSTKRSRSSRWRR